MEFVRYIGRLIAIGLAPLAVMTVCGCSDTETMQELRADEISMSLRLTAGIAGGTRAVTEEMGTASENHIDLDDLKILVFDAEGTLYDVLYDCGGTFSGKGSQSVLECIGQYTYVLRTKLNCDYYNRSSRFAIVALANWRSIASDKALSKDWGGMDIGEASVGKLKIDDLKAAIFTLDPMGSADGDEIVESWMPGDGRWIPFFGSMYGSLEHYDKDIFNAANPMQLGDINLVRAFAKIEIINNDLAEDAPEITDIELVNRNTRGRLMQDFTLTLPTGQVSVPTVPGNGGFTENALRFHRDGNVYTAYIPEMSLENANELRRAIRVNIDLNGQRGVKWIYLAPYNSRGVPLIQSTYPEEWRNICRNNIYRYTINSLGFDFVISCERWIYGGKVHIQFEQ